MDIRDGQLLVGKYRVERVLGRGGMGVVVAAHHIELDEPVALKFLLPEALQSAESVTRFEREARAAVKIRSEHVARVFDVGRLETGEPYMVMELLRGLDLGQLLEKHGPLPAADVADYVLQACEAIAEAHQLGIVHRDLKPQNLFLTHRADGSPCVKVLDFGISKMSTLGSGHTPAVTATMMVLGSPLYMSPEQLMSARDIDSRTDVWALGVICFQLLTGRTPFIGPTLPQLCMAITASEPLTLRSLLPDAPAELEATILRCLEKDRNRRTPSLSELARELAPFGLPRSQLSVERIERLGRASQPSPALARPSPVLETTRVSSPTIAEPASAPSAPESTPPATGADPRTLGDFGRTKDAPRHPRRAGLLALLALPLLGAGAAGLWLGAAPRASIPPLPASTSVAAAPASLASAPAAVRTEPPPLAAPPASASVAVEAPPKPPASANPSPPRAPSPPPRAVAAPPRAVVAPPQAVAAPPPKVDCDIPYSYDAKGNKIFKKACL